MVTMILARANADETILITICFCFPFKFIPLYPWVFCLPPKKGNTLSPRKLIARCWKHLLEWYYSEGACGWLQCLELFEIGSYHGCTIYHSTQRDFTFTAKEEPFATHNILLHHQPGTMIWGIIFNYRFLLSSGALNDPILLRYLVELLALYISILVVAVAGVDKLNLLSGLMDWLSR